MTKQRHNILILNGPNLNLLGVREVDVYGAKTLSAIALECEAQADKLGFTIDFRQSNHEGEIVTILQDERKNISGLIINAGGYTHTSVAIHDALKILDVPVIEVHLTNIFQRESFRHVSYVAPVAAGVISGFGAYGYIMALDAMNGLLKK